MTRGLLLSISLHAVVIALIIFLAWPKPSKQPGWQTAMTARLINKLNSNTVKNNHTHRAKHETLHLNQQGINVNQKKQQKITAPSHHENHGQAVQPPSQLLIKLHNAIQLKVDESSYLIPDFLKGRQAEVEFKLTPSKRIKSLAIIKSSGSRRLDQLALNAVQQVSPPTVKQEQTFRVDLVFN